MSHQIDPDANAFAYVWARTQTKAEFIQCVQELGRFCQLEIWPDSVLDIIWEAMAHAGSVGYSKGKAA